ncbi:MAG: epoxide hydrolase [Deltaproteobacteria bacterium]|nr:epoxide hydrolase [Deltaproteobacteria bacterium]
MPATLELTLHANDLDFSATSQGEGPTVLCLHGFPDHRGSYRCQLPALAEAGFQALAPTLRGYEPSSQPKDGDYHIVRMAEDAVAQVDALGPEPVHLVGHDWGAVIGYAAVVLAPDRFLSLTTLAIPHPGRLGEGLRKVPSQLCNSWYMAFFQLRGLADRVVERKDWAFIERLWRDWSPGWELPQEELRAVKETLAQPGVKRAALGYYRAMADRRSAAARETAKLLDSEIPVPTLALTGALDGCMDTRLHDLTMKKADFPAGFEVVRIEGAGHFLHQEKPEEVNPILIDWLRRHTAPEGGAR